MHSHIINPTVMLVERTDTQNGFVLRMQSSGFWFSGRVGVPVRVDLPSSVEEEVEFRFPRIICIHG